MGTLGLIGKCVVARFKQRTRSSRPEELTMAKHLQNNHARPHQSRKRSADAKHERSPSQPHETRARHPAHLEELEQAAQTDIIGDDLDEAGRPVDDEAHAGIAFSDWQPERTPVDAGLSIDPEDLGRQFLRGATEQDNFESELNRSDDDLQGAPLGQMISDATLESSGQDDMERPASGALDGSDDDERDESASDDVDLLSNVIREASLFDQPTERGGTRAPLSYCTPIRTSCSST
jgi:hypothetical protein